jgi:tetratricopeptide (TPR) repeat protein
LHLAPTGRPASLVATLFLAILAATPVLGHQGLHDQIEDLTARIAEDPRNPALYLKRGELQRTHQDWDAAMADFERVRHLDPYLAEVDLAIGRLGLESGDAEGAQKSLDRFLIRRPDDTRALALRGWARAALGDRAGGAADFSRALALTPEGALPPPSLYLERARLLAAAGSGHLDEALGGLEEGLERLGSPVTLEVAALDLEERLGRTDAALARLDRLVASSAQPAWWLVRKGEILEQAERFEEARIAFRSAAEALERLPLARRRATAFAELGEQVRASLNRLSAAEPQGESGD